MILSRGTLTLTGDGAGACDKDALSPVGSTAADSAKSSGLARERKTAGSEPFIGDSEANRADPRGKIGKTSEGSGALDTSRSFAQIGAKLNLLRMGDPGILPAPSGIGARPEEISQAFSNQG